MKYENCLRKFYVNKFCLKLPESYVFTPITLLNLFLVAWTERIQGGQYMKFAREREKKI